jgi:L-threonylcarbamoyladenylate synthase
MSWRGRTLDLRGDPDADLREVVEHVRAGGVVAYPTETVYGLGGACTPGGVRAVRAVKGRADEKPLLALVPSRESVEHLTWTDAARELASIFWPGALTLVLADPDRIFPAGVRAFATGAVGVRVTSHPVAARLVEALGAPLTSTSLNEPAQPPAVSGSEARSVLERLGANGVWLLDGGTLPPSMPSTVVDCTGDEPLVLREGAVPVERLRCAIPEIHGTTAS